LPLLQSNGSGCFVWGSFASIFASVLSFRISHNKPYVMNNVIHFQTISSLTCQEVFVYDIILSWTNRFHNQLVQSLRVNCNVWSAENEIYSNVPKVIRLIDTVSAWSFPHVNRFNVRVPS